MDTVKDKFASIVNLYYDNGEKLISNSSITRKQCISISAAATITFVVWRLYRRASSRNNNIDPSLLPPSVKGGIPILGHLLELQENPREFLDSARDNLGPTFSIKVPGQGNLIVVTGPLIEEVMRNTKNFSFSLGIESIVPTAKVVKESYKHKFVAEDISPREKHPSKTTCRLYVK